MKAFLEEIATHQHCQTVEDLYAALGYGGIQLWRLSQEFGIIIIKLRSL